MQVQMNFSILYRCKNETRITGGAGERSGHTSIAVPFGTTFTFVNAALVIHSVFASVKYTSLLSVGAPARKSYYWQFPLSWLSFPRHFVRFRQFCVFAYTLNQLYLIFLQSPVNSTFYAGHVCLKTPKGWASEGFNQKKWSSKNNFLPFTSNFLCRQQQLSLLTVLISIIAVQSHNSLWSTLQPQHAPHTLKIILSSLTHSRVMTYLF